MDSWLENILINTYNPNPQLRKDAEKSLQNFLATGGSLTTLLNTLANRAIHRDLRQAIALIIKNRLRDYLNKSSTGANKLPLVDGERDFLKNAIIALMLDEEENSIRKILAESIRIVAETEFPKE